MKYIYYIIFYTIFFSLFSVKWDKYKNEYVYYLQLVVQT
jgi:hypothetical protein